MSELEVILFPTEITKKPQPIWQSQRREKTISQCLVSKSLYPLGPAFPASKMWFFHQSFAVICSYRMWVVNACCATMLQCCLWGSGGRRTCFTWQDGCWTWSRVKRHLHPCAFTPEDFLVWEMKRGVCEYVVWHAVFIGTVLPTTFGSTLTAT